VMIAFGVGDLLERMKAGVVAVGVAVAVMVALCFMTYQQVAYWHSNEELWSHTIAVTSNNFVAEDNLGGALILEGKEEQAHPHFEAAALINPRDPMSHSNLGTYDLSHGQVSTAIQHYQAAVESTSDPGLLAQTYANLGAAYRITGQLAEAQENYNKALRLNPNQFNAWLGLGLIAQRQGKTDEAIRNLSRSVELQPSGHALLALGKALEQSGRFAEALGAYDRAKEISPGLTDAQQAGDSLRYQMNHLTQTH